MPRVSVVLPTYNRAELLPKSVQSILDQDFTDLELIIIDDGSTDNTEEIVRVLHEKHSEIKYFRLPSNKGVGYVRNFALNHCGGEYIAWSDSDDPWLQGKLRTQVEILEKQGEIDILFADYKNIDHRCGRRESTLFEKNKQILDTLRTYRLDNNLFIIQYGIEQALLQQTIVSIPTVMLRASCIKRVGGFDESLRCGEDLEFFFRAALMGASFGYLDHVVMERHKTDTSITANRSKSWKEILRALDRCELWCEKTQRNDLLPLVRAAQQRAVRNLISAYGRKRQRGCALQAFRQGLNYGFSVRAFITLMAALSGPEVIKLMGHLRTKQISNASPAVPGKKG